jgi:hypothetical protein
MLSSILSFLGFESGAREIDDLNLQNSVSFSFSRSNFKANVNYMADGASLPSQMSTGHTILATLSIGSPARPFNILFDTGSALFWMINAQGCSSMVGNISYPTCPGGNQYLGQNRY